MSNWQPYNQQLKTSPQHTVRIPQYMVREFRRQWCGISARSVHFRSISCDFRRSFCASARSCAEIPEMEMVWNCARLISFRQAPWTCACFMSIFKSHSPSFTHSLSLSLSISHSLSLDMLNKFCFHVYAQKSLFIAENCNGFFWTSASSSSPYPLTLEFIELVPS